MRPKFFSAAAASASAVSGVGDVADHDRRLAAYGRDLAGDLVGFRLVRAHIDHYRGAGIGKR